MVVIKAMGMESDQEVTQMVGRDPRYSYLLLASFEVINVHTCCVKYYYTFIHNKL